MKSRLQALQEKALRLQAHKELLEKQKLSITVEMGELEEEHVLLNQVQMLFKQLLQKYVYAYAESFSGIISQGMQTIFYDQDISFDIEVSESRGRIAVRFITEHNEHRGNVLDSFGGGVAGVQSLLLRILVLLKTKQAPYLFLDEPLAALSKKYVPSCGQFLKELCADLGVNMLIVTHQAEFLDYADHAYKAEDNGKGATVLKPL